MKDSLPKDHFKKLRNGNQRRSLEYQKLLKLIDLPVEKWPEFVIAWDLRKESQRFYEDGFEEAEFKKEFPKPLKIAWVTLKNLDDNFVRYSQRSKDEIWSIASSLKVARAIVHWVAGNKMTPCHIIPACDDKKITVVGGHHRLAVCRAKDVELLPVLVKEKDINILKRIIEITSVEEAS